jgi:hypothetical protein
VTLVSRTHRVVTGKEATMSPARIIAAVTLTAVVIATGSYLALSTNSHRATTPAAPVAAVPPANPATKAPAGAGGATSSESVVLADGRHPVLLKAIDAGRGSVTFDLVQVFRDEEATREAAKDHLEADNDFYTRNVNPRLRTLPVGAGASITANQLAGSNQDVPVTLAKLSSLTRAGSGVFWITVRGGQIVQVAEQWSP